MYDMERNTSKVGAKTWRGTETDIEGRTTTETRI
jgi:hypothetical protein